MEVRVDKATSVTRGDTGADTTILSAPILQNVIARTPLVEIRELETPLELSLTVQGKEVPTVSVRRDIQIPIITFLPVILLPVRVRNVKVVVAEMEMHSVLLDQDLLDHLAFD